MSALKYINNDQNSSRKWNFLEETTNIIKQYGYKLCDVTEYYLVIYPNRGTDLIMSAKYEMKFIEVINKIKKQQPQPQPQFQFQSQSQSYDINDYKMIVLKGKNFLKNVIENPENKKILNFNYNPRNCSERLRENFFSFPSPSAYPPYFPPYFPHSHITHITPFDLLTVAGWVKFKNGSYLIRETDVDEYFTNDFTHNYFNDNLNSDEYGDEYDDEYEPDEPENIIEFWELIGPLPSIQAWDEMLFPSNKPHFQQ